MAKTTTVREAIAQFEKAKGCVAADEVKVELLGMCPPIEKLDAGLGVLKACKHLSLSTNNIDKIAALSGLDNLEILSLGRNQLKKIENVEPVAATLKQLWISYNLLDKLSGVEKLPNLRVLYASNNKLSSWADLDKVNQLPKLEELLLAGNPLYNDYRDRGALAEYRVEVIKRIPQLQKLDGAPIEGDERDAATSGTMAATVAA